MQTRSTDAIPLPARPNLEQYRTLAKNLLKAARVSDGAAVRVWATDWVRSLARSEGRTETRQHPQADVPRYLNWSLVDREVDRILEDIGRSRLGAISGEPVRRTLSQAQLIVARLHGFESWPKFVHHLESRERPSTIVAQFESAADAVVTGNIDALSSLLRSNRQLARARSKRDHNATLLHYVAANGHEGFRQRSPQNAVQIARVLLDSGAEPDALARM
jgi:hypothetical protein